MKPLQPVACVEFHAKLTSPRSIQIHGGDTPAKASSGQYASKTPPSLKLCDEVLDKLGLAIHSTQTAILLNIDSDGQTIIEDPSFKPLAPAAPAAPAVALTRLSEPVPAKRPKKATKKSAKSSSVKRKMSGGKRSPKKPPMSRPN
jgi:hypothetical protein